MGFDFYFAGTQSPQTTDLLISLNANILRSYANDLSSIKSLIELKKEGKYNGKLLIDSGAFTVHRKGTTIDIDKYISWLNENSKWLDYFIQLDHIPGVFGQVRTFEHVKESTDKSWDNYLFMIDRLNEPRKLVPVFHKNEPYSHLERIVNHKIDGRYIDYVCISGEKDRINDDRARWVNNCFTVIKNSENPNIKVHYLGCAIKSELEMFPFTSSDATSWLMASANGSIITEFGPVLMSNRKENDSSNFVNLPEAAKQKIEALAHRYGTTIELLKDDYKSRSDFNVRHLHEWATNYKYNGLKTFKKGGLF